MCVFSVTLQQDSAYEWIKLNKYLTQPIWWLMKLLRRDIIGGGSVICSLDAAAADDDDAVDLVIWTHLCQLSAWLPFPTLLTVWREVKGNYVKMKYDVSLFWCLLHISQENGTCTHICAKRICCMSYSALGTLAVQVCLCYCVILVTFVTLFSSGVCVCHVWLKLTSLRWLVHPSTASPTPLSLSSLYPSTSPPLFYSIPILFPPGSAGQYTQGPTLPFWLPRVVFPWKQCQSWLGEYR